MHRLILWCLLCLSPAQVPAQAQTDLNEVHLLNEVASRSQLLSASALLYFNPDVRTPDPRSLTAAYYHLNTLASHVQQLGKPRDLARPLQAIQRSFAELDRLPRKERQGYPALLETLLQQQWQLQQAAVSAYAAVASGLDEQAQVLLLHQQSLDLGSLLLDQQLRQYAWPNGVPVPLLGARVQLLDQAVAQRFTELQLQLAAEDQQALLLKVQRSYKFVRLMLIGDEAGSHGGAEFYLSRAVLDLDELALNQLQSVP
jgi:hypothetical protein